jgi:CCR4-NOT transcription complex subunit 3
LRQQQAAQQQQLQRQQQEALLRQQQEALRQQQQRQEAAAKQKAMQQQELLRQQQAQQEALKRQQQAAQQQALQQQQAQSPDKKPQLQSQSSQGSAGGGVAGLDLLTSGLGGLNLAGGNGNAPDGSYLSALNESFATMPGLADSERARSYTPQNPYPTPASYPAQPSPIFDNPAVFEKLGTDCLFFIFYYAQGTYQQYLALITKLAGAHVLSKTFALSTLSWKTPCSNRGDLLGHSGRLKYKRHHLF